MNSSTSIIPITADAHTVRTRFRRWQPALLIIT